MVNSILGEGSLFKGELTGDDLIRIEGDFSGMVKNENDEVLLGQTSRFKGNIYSHNLTISGIFKGSLYIKGKLFIASNAIVIGNIYTKALEVEKGAILSVEVTMEKDETNEQDSEREIKDKGFTRRFSGKNQNSLKDSIL